MLKDQLEIDPQHKINLTATVVVGRRDVLISRTISHLSKGCTKRLLNINNIRSPSANAEVRSI